MTGTVGRYVVTLTGIGLVMLLITNARAVNSIVGAFVGVVKQVFALGNVNG
jgi:hypothetical protein